MKIFVVTLILFLIFNIIPLQTHADDHRGCDRDAFGCFEVFHTLPGVSQEDPGNVGEFATMKGMVKTISIIAQFIMGITVLLGVIGVVIGGYLYMTASGNASQVEKGKQWIASALLGIILALASVVILNTINPELGEEAREPELHGSGGAGGGSGGGGSSGGGGEPISPILAPDRSNGLPIDTGSPQDTVQEREPSPRTLENTVREQGDGTYEFLIDLIHYHNNEFAFTIDSDRLTSTTDPHIVGDFAAHAAEWRVSSQRFNVDNSILAKELHDLANRHTLLTPPQ